MSVETLAFGFGLVEAPRWSEDGLYFSDILEGGVYRLDAAGTVEVVIPRRRRVGGIALHAEGGIVVSGRDVSHVHRGATRTLLRRDGVVFNDLCCDAAGRIHVGAVWSDPAHPGETLGEALRIDGAGSARSLYAGLPIPNGIGFSPDQKRLYHADSAWRRVHVHDIDAEGRASGRRVLVDLSDGHGPHFEWPSPWTTPDGLALDEAGGVWVALAGAGRVQRYGADGTPDVAIEVPARGVTSVAFGGADRRDLYVVSSDNTDDPARRGSIFRVRAAHTGLAMQRARV